MLKYQQVLKLTKQFVDVNEQIQLHMPTINYRKTMQLCFENSVEQQRQQLKYQPIDTQGKTKNKLSCLIQCFLLQTIGKNIIGNNDVTASGTTSDIQKVMRISTIYPHRAS